MTTRSDAATPAETPWMRAPFIHEAERALGLLLLCRDSGSQATGEDWAAAWLRAESALGASTGYKPPPKERSDV